MAAIWLVISSYIADYGESNPTPAPTAPPTHAPTHAPTRMPTPTPTCNQLVAVDIAFILDTSTSIDKYPNAIVNWPAQVSFAKAVINDMKAAPDIKFAGLLFDDAVAELQTYAAAPGGATSLKDEIDKYVYYRAAVNTSFPKGTLDCQCKTGATGDDETYGYDCTTENHDTEWCYIADGSVCPDSVTTISHRGPWSEHACIVQPIRRTHTWQVLKHVRESLNIGASGYRGAPAAIPAVIILTDGLPTCDTSFSTDATAFCTNSNTGDAISEASLLKASGVQLFVVVVDQELLELINGDLISQLATSANHLIYTSSFSSLDTSAFQYNVTSRLCNNLQTSAPTHIPSPVPTNAPITFAPTASPSVCTACAGTFAAAGGLYGRRPIFAHSVWMRQLW